MSLKSQKERWPALVLKYKPHSSICARGTTRVATGQLPFLREILSVPLDTFTEKKVLRAPRQFFGEENLENAPRHFFGSNSESEHS